MANNNNQIITIRKVLIDNYQLEAHSQVAKAIEHVTSQYIYLAQSESSVL